MGTSTWLILWGSPVGIAIFFAGLGVLLWGLGKLKHAEAAKAEVEAWADYQRAIARYTVATGRGL